MTALYMAVKKGNLEVVKVLCLHPSTDIKIPFLLSIDSGKQVIPEKEYFWRRKLLSTNKI